MSDPHAPEDQAATAAVVTDTRARLAYLIRAELVCCDIYEKVNAPFADLREGDPYSLYREKRAERDTLREIARRDHSWHDICYFGEWSAQLCLNGKLPEGELFYGEWNPAWGTPCEANRPKRKKIPGAL